VASFHDLGQQRGHGGQRVGDRAVDVVLVVGLRRAEKDDHLVEAIGVLQGGVEAALVGNEHRAGDAVGDRDAGEHVGGIGQLGEHIGPDEARDLDATQPRARECIDQPDLVWGRDRLGLVLKAVPGTDLANVGPLGEGIESHGARIGLTARRSGG
jgi:hypothetical protein